MSQRIYKACHRAVCAQHGSPRNSFLDQLIDAIDPLPAEIFAQNDRADIYSLMEPVLGPWNGLLHRKAAMCEALRILAAFESDWNWEEGVDVNNHYSQTHLEGEETGAFQVSADSMAHDRSLVECVERHEGRHDPRTFINAMKSNRPLAVEYCARLLRFNTTWSGTINDPDQVLAHLRRDAVEEFQSLLKPLGDGTAAPTALAIRAATTALARADKNCIDRLLLLASTLPDLDSAQKRAAEALLRYDGEVYPQDGCAITLSVLLNDAGIEVPLIFQVIKFGEYLREKRKWEVIPVGQQVAGDIGSTCGDVPKHGRDHVYLVLKKLNEDEMLIADNQSTKPHFRYASGQGGKSPTRFFLRAV